MLGVSVRSVARLVDDGLAPLTMMRTAGNQRRYLVDDVRELARRQLDAGGGGKVEL